LQLLGQRSAFQVSKDQLRETKCLHCRSEGCMSDVTVTTISVKLCITSLVTSTYLCISERLPSLQAGVC